MYINLFSLCWFAKRLLLLYVALISDFFRFTVFGATLCCDFRLCHPLRGVGLGLDPYLRSLYVESVQFNFISAGSLKINVVYRCSTEPRG